MFIFNLGIAAFKAYCAIWVRRSIFRHQASPRVSPRKKCLRILSKMSTPTLHLGIFHRLLYFPSEGRHAEKFFTLKILRLRPGANPRTWVRKASTLPLDHRSHKYSPYILRYILCFLKIFFFYFLLLIKLILLQRELLIYEYQKNVLYKS
jgi:hypothetical protein